MPHSIRRAARDLHEHFSQFMDVQDIEEHTIQRLKDQESEFDDEKGQELEVNYKELSQRSHDEEGEESLKKLEKEVKKVNINQLKKKIVLDRAISRKGTARSRRGNSPSQMDEPFDIVKANNEFFNDAVRKTQQLFQDINGNGSERSLASAKSSRATSEKKPKSFKDEDG